MTRTTINLDDALARAIRQLADSQKRSQADVIREALTAYVESHPAERALPPGVGAFRSGRADIAERAEVILKKAARESE